MKLLSSVLFFAIATTATAFANPLQVHVHGLQRDTGAIVVNLFAHPESWDHETPDKVIQITPLQSADAVTTLDLPAGDYAFFLYHDVDGDGELKRGAFGLPGEPYAFSNNVHIGFSKPSYQKMKFTVGPAGAVQDIQLVNP